MCCSLIKGPHALSLDKKLLFSSSASIKGKIKNKIEAATHLVDELQ
jgi:hypothetical protein